MVNRSYVQRISENHLKNMADRAEMPEVCDELRFGYTESECREALMCFYDLLKEIYTAISEQPEKLKLPVIPEIPGNYSGAEYMKSYHAFFGVPHFLSCLGEAGVPGGDREMVNLNVNGEQLREACSRMKIKNVDSLFPLLDNFGFYYTEVEGCSGKIRLKDLQFLVLRHKEHPLLLLGIKIMSEACNNLKNKENAYFRRGDFRVAAAIFQAGPDLCLEDAVKSLGEESDQKFVRDLDALLVRIGCQPTVRIGGLDRGDWKIIYTHKKVKQKLFATVFIGPNGVIVKMNLRNMHQYETYIEECPEEMQRDIIMVDSCSGCAKQCGGIRFSLHGKNYCKCTNESFRFYHPDIGHLPFYRHMIDAEFQAAQ